MYLLAPLILQNFKKILRTDPELWGCAIFRPKTALLSWTNFLVQTIIITFIYLLDLFIVPNFKKFLQRIQSYDDVPFLGPKWSICPKQFFFWKLLTSFPSISPFHCAKFRITKTIQRIQSYEDMQFLGPKWAICPNENVFRKPTNEPCSFHSCLSTCQKLKWDINLLVK